jgi:hypothetical protein
MKDQLDRDLAPHTTRAFALIDSRLADARAHAERGALQTGKARLAELAGSLGRHLRDARGAFYRRSFALHRQAGLDPTIHQTELQPTPEGEKVARDAQIFGRNADLDLAGLVEDSSTALQSAYLSAADDRTPRAAAQALWSAWENDQHERLMGFAERELSDAQIAIYNAIGRILVRPELR